MALNIPLPRRILTHAHWTLGNQKMAKSTGNVVNPFFALDRFGVDVMRFYLAHDGGLVNDADYSNEHIIERYKHCLYGQLGNLASRITRGKGWSLTTVIKSVEAESWLVQGPDYKADNMQWKALVKLEHEVSLEMEKYKVKDALHTIMNTIYKVYLPSRYFVLDQPANVLYRQTLTSSINNLGTLPATTPTLLPIHVSIL
jgi:methionyl-tRNA synthetase